VSEGNTGVRGFSSTGATVEGNKTLGALNGGGGLSDLHTPGQMYAVTHYGPGFFQPGLENRLLWLGDENLDVVEVQARFPQIQWSGRGSWRDDRPTEQVRAFDTG
jgi:hypothetical protein